MHDVIGAASIDPGVPRFARIEHASPALLPSSGEATESGGWPPAPGGDQMGRRSAYFDRAAFARQLTGAGDARPTRSMHSEPRCLNWRSWSGTSTWR